MRGENNGQGLLRTLIVLSVPTIIEQLLSTLLQYVDTAMVGRLGEQATASVSITTTITWLVNSIPSAIGVAVLALVARYLGSRDNAAIKDISKQSLILVVISGILLGGISVLLSPFIPRWMGAEEAIQEQAAIYFAIISIPMVFRSASTVFGAAIRATKDTKTPMIISVLANVINIVCNALFIYGLHWGVTGAAIGSALSYIFFRYCHVLCLPQKRCPVFLFKRTKHKQQKTSRVRQSRRTYSWNKSCFLSRLCCICQSCLGYGHYYLCCTLNRRNGGNALLHTRLWASHSNLHPYRTCARGKGPEKV